MSRNSIDSNPSDNPHPEKNEELEPFRVFLISDIHTDEEENWKDILSHFKNGPYNPDHDYLILAGDISKYEEVVEATFKAIRPFFKEVLFCPGNNELRLRKKDSYSDSIEKFHSILKLAEKNDIRTSPLQIGEFLTIVPLFAWYEPKFKKDWSGDSSYQKQWLDFYQVHWPSELKNDQYDGPSNYFLKLNQELGHIQKYQTPIVISFSHFMPRPDLLPPSMFMKKTFPLVVGCIGIEEQLRSIGNTHISLDTTIEGVRYVQHAAGHPNERSKFWYKGGTSPKLIFSSRDFSSKSSCLIQ